MLTTEQKNKLKKEVKETIDLMHDDVQDFYYLRSLFHQTTFEEGNNYESMYANATEDMKGYYSEFGTPVTFLTVGGGGDQAINAVDIGAKKIDVFDLNYLSKRAVALRIAAVRALPQDKFMEFYKTFKESDYTKVSKYLSEDNRAYWDSIYDWADSSTIRRNLFSYDKLTPELVKSINPYMADDHYKEIQGKLGDADITYYDADLYHLPEFLGDKTYDAMNFSNVYEYLNFGLKVSRENATRYREFVEKELLPRLNEGGTMMLAYLYAFNENIRKELSRVYQVTPDAFIPSGAMQTDKVMNFIKGYTTQNLSFLFLMDALEGLPIKQVPTEHIRFGQSSDMSHDLALCLKK